MCYIGFFFQKGDNKMSEKRKDSKGRVLRSGESQRPDGKYMFRYTDAKGVRRYVYSWKLVDTDKVPAGKKCEESLREMEKKLIRDVEDDINSFDAQKTTLNHFFDIYIAGKRNLKQSTRTNYKYMYTKYVYNEIGLMDLASIKYSHIRKFYLSLIHDLNFKPNSMEVIHTILHPIFTTAVRDGYIRLNPTDGVMTEIKRSHDWEKPKRHALTEQQQSAFVNYIANSEKYKHWQPIFTVILGTGARIGEVVGLRWQDCDFDNNIIDINHSLIYRQQDNGKVEYHITTPKTKAGTRIIPMFQEVKRALLQEKRRQFETGFNTSVIDGYSGFIFQNRFGDVMSPHNVNRAIERIYKDYNEEETELAAVENREPELIPHFSVHNLRHTFCTRFCENETNLKVIQEIMGHSNIETTMDVYNEATKEKKIESFARLEGKIKIS